MVAIKTLVSKGVSKSYQVLKYVFVARRPAKIAYSKQAELEEGWVLVEEDDTGNGWKLVSSAEYQLAADEDAMVRIVCESTFNLLCHR